MSIIDANKEIKFVGEYNISQSSFEKIPGFPGGNLGHITNITGVCGNTFISNNFTVTRTGLLGGEVYADETYSMVSYPPGDKDVIKLGSLIWSGTYREKIDGSGRTAPSIQRFAVTAADGIYSGVTEVVMDFNNIVRVLYFLGPRRPLTV